jgi:hypothetical protein
MIEKYNLLRRRSAGQSLIELCVGLIIFVPVILVLIDLGVMLFGVELNDKNCRIAVRAAAAGSPAEAQVRAQSVLRESESARHIDMLGQSQIVLPVNVAVSSEPQSEKDFAAEKQIFPGGPVIGTATVTTEIRINSLFIHVLYGAKSPLLFRATHSEPICCVLPAR